MDLFIKTVSFIKPDCKRKFNTNLLTRSLKSTYQWIATRSVASLAITKTSDEAIHKKKKESITKSREFSQA